MIHTSGVEKKNGRDSNLGGPIAWTSVNQAAVDIISILAVTTQPAADGVVTYTDGAADFAAQPLHPRPLKVSVATLAAGATGVRVTLYGKDFWNNPAIPETHVFVATGTWTCLTSIRFLTAATFEVLGDAAGTADFSIGMGAGLGTPVRFGDATLDMDENIDFLAVRNPNDASKFTIVTLHPNPYNTIVYSETDPAPDVTIEMQTRYDALGTAKS